MMGMTYVGRLLLEAASFHRPHCAAWSYKYLLCKYVRNTIKGDT